MPSPAVISVLARSMAAGEPDIEGVYERGVRTLGRPWGWLRSLARRYVEAFAGKTRPRHRDVVQFLFHDAEFQRASRKSRNEISIAEWTPEPQRMQPVAAAGSWSVPAIESARALADWLCLGIAELEWLADLKGLGCKLHRPKLEHYHYVVAPKRSGGIRLTERPKPRLKEAQRRILFEILDRIPAHPSVHGFVKGRSIVSFAAPHAGRSAVLRLDLEDFFPAFPAARVEALFRTLGYPENVAATLAGLCTNAVPRNAWNCRPSQVSLEDWRAEAQLYSRRHLPQGAPTSPALANLMAYRMDCRLSGLAQSAGAVYTRYADDLAFSGNESFARAVERFSIHAAAIALEEGFRVNHHKTRIMRRGVRQQIAGVVVNQRLNLRRGQMELLEAILTNCVRRGPASQNRNGVANFRAHLEGRVGYVEMVNRIKGERLRALFDAIQWGE